MKDTELKFFLVYWLLLLSLERSISEVILEQMSSLFGSFSILPSKGETTDWRFENSMAAANPNEEDPKLEDSSSPPDETKVYCQTREDHDQNNVSKIKMIHIL
ncbi:hypothetical protein I3843_Q000800 [Carya illinoinensis]|nr:hypothetical protein I3843_Q000800 [Carya illinoinensis]